MGPVKVRSIVNLSLVVACVLVLVTADTALAQQDRRITRKREASCSGDRKLKEVPGK